MIRFIVQGFFVSLMALVLGGCNTANSDAPPVNAVHQEGWLVEHGAEAAGDVEGCKVCHGVESALAGSSVDACMSCHSSSPEVTTTGCNSCHGQPPTLGAHATHNALSGVANVCTTCHDGAGTGTDAHFDSVTDVSIDTVYSAKSGAAVYNAVGTCSNVSCHGGQTTPNMIGGTINVNADCTSCHEYGTAQYNSYSSGRHVSHAGGYASSCIVCHDTTALAVEHFSALDTQTIEGDAGLTISGSGIISYDAGTTSCLAACHSAGVRTW